MREIKKLSDTLEDSHWHFNLNIVGLIINEGVVRTRKNSIMLASKAQKETPRDYKWQKNSRSSYERGIHTRAYTHKHRAASRRVRYLTLQNGPRLRERPLNNIFNCDE